MIIKIKAFPKSDREEVVKISEDEYKVYLKKDAIDNKANFELLKILKEYFKSETKIIKGMKGRNKIVEIEG